MSYPDLQAKGFGLSLSGLRTGPLDPKSKVPKVGSLQQYQIEDGRSVKEPKWVNKERSGFSGGFKIPEEQRRAKLGRKIKHQDGDDSEDQEEFNKNDITKDEIMQHLNLGSSQAAGGMGKHGTGSKTALTKDLIENLEKELEKLRRTEENIKVRKHIALKGDRSILDETEEDRQRAKNQAIDDEMKAEGNNVIHADQKRIQVMRHRVGQLDSVKKVPYEELEALRTETAARLKVLEDQYWGQKDKSQWSKIMRDKYKKYGTATLDAGGCCTIDESLEPAIERGGATKAASTPGPGILKKAPSVGESLAKPKFDYRNLSKDGGTPGAAGKGRSRSRSTKKRESIEPAPLAYSDPRRQIYEAKYEKYLANKKAKTDQEQRRAAAAQADFDLYTKGLESPSRNTKRFKTIIDPNDAQFSGKYHADDLLPPEHDDDLLRQSELQQQQRQRGDPFANLGVGTADKMTFFLLKWVFNAIKRDSADDDPKFQGRPYMSKNDLIKQLSKNPELLHALGYADARQLTDNVKLAACNKDGFLMWSEFLDFVYLRDAPLHDRIDGDDWWNQIDSKGNQVYRQQPESQAEGAEGGESNKENTDANNARASSPGAPTAGGFKSSAERRPVKVTPSLHMLQASRATRAEREVEDEFKQMAADKKASSKATLAAPKPAGKKAPEYESLDTEAGEGFGFARERSKNLLLNSQAEVMREVFERLDKYNEGILRRSDFVMALRTDARVIDFIDCEAVKKAYSKSTLTLDVVLLEIEKDERYDQAHQSRGDQINHKEFITWREFLNYFSDYQEIEQRNRKQSQMQQTQKVLKKDTGATSDPEADAANEIKTLMEQEKERRLQELPKLRPADQIDISEKQLQLIKDIFDSIPRAPGGKDSVNVLTFFLTFRKDPQIRAINTAIARDPEGCSRVPKETFQEVFDRMERELQQKTVDWSVVVEFFTKRGRPLSKDEIQKLAEEDRREREAEQTRLRVEEEAERRRNQRIMGDLEEEEDYEAFEMRQKAEQTVADHEAETFDRQHAGGAQGNDLYDDEDEDDDLRRDGDFDASGGEYDANQTTKASDLGEHLSRTKLTQKDYMARSQSAKAAAKGKYGVTVPKPFGFDMRDKGKHKTIRERKVEAMVEEKRLEEEALVKHQFRSKPIPTDVLIPRYQSIQEAELARRQAVRAQSMTITRQTEAPFKFWEKEKQRLARRTAEALEHEQPDASRATFRANPIPRACSVLIFAKKMKQDELKRGERIRKNAEMAYAKAKMPPTMQKHADRKKQEPPKKLDIEYTFKPDIGPTVTGEMLQARAERFQHDLAKKKGQKTQTQPRSPNFVKRPRKLLDRSYVNEGETQNSESQAQKALAAQRRLAESTRSQAGPQVAPPSTKATALAQAKRREEMQEKRKQDDEKRQKDADRAQPPAAMTKALQGAMKSKFGKSSATVISEKAAAARRDARAAEKKHVEEQEARLAAKLAGRPLLCESSGGGRPASANLAYLQATTKMLDIMAAHGEAQPARQLPPEARARLEEAQLEKDLQDKWRGGAK